MTRDGGSTWTDLDPAKSLPPRPVNGLAFDPTNPNVLYAGLSSFDDGTPGKPGHVFKSTNALAAGPTWTNVSPPENQPFNVIAIDPTNTNLVYAGSDTGLWRSLDGARTWVHMGPEVGLPNAPIYDFKINPSTGRTVAFTYGRSAFALGPEIVGGASSPANGATYIAGGLVPGSWAQVQGRNLAGVTRIWGTPDFAGLGQALPTKLGGVQVKVNGTDAAVYFVSPTQISFQVPNGVTGTATVQVFRDGVPSNVLSTQATVSSPGIFPVIVNGKNYAAAVFLDGKIAGDPANGAVFRRARAGDVLQLYATGLSPSPAGTTVGVQLLPDITVAIGPVSFSADATALVAPGEFQINFTLPQQFATLAAGDYPIAIRIGGASSPSLINSAPPGQILLPIER